MGHLFLVTVFLASGVWAFPTPSEDKPAVKSSLQAMSYLTRFGYIEPSSPQHGNLMAQDFFEHSIKEFQRFAGLNQTGLLDNDTLTMMNMPRCGVKDTVGHSNSARKKRYALQGSRWRVKQLTYKISKYPSGGRLTTDEVDAEVRKSFEVWSGYTDLTFVQKASGKVHIDVRFERGEHGDGDPFDGAGGTLAHAYFPIYGGDAHFDDAERWTINSYKGTNLFQVAAHEFGHSLGLSHTDEKGALMAPFYRGYTANFKMHEDDVQGIQSLYGEKATSDLKPKTTSPRTRISTDPDGAHEEGELCSDSSIDTIFMVGDDTFAFKGDYYWRLTDTGLADGYPRYISRDWKGLPSNLDAAFSWRNGKTYFFKGGLYWRFEGKEMDADYPQKISEGFPGVPDSVDAALVWSGNGKIYFFKDANYWRFDPQLFPPVSSDYPKSVSTWGGIPDGVNAAFQWSNGYTYFFKGTSYWRFNDRTFTIDKGTPPFPRSSAVWWFGCKSMTADDDPYAGLPAAAGVRSYPAASETKTNDTTNYIDVMVNDDAEVHQPDAHSPSMAMKGGQPGTGWSDTRVLSASLLALIFALLLQG